VSDAKAKRLRASVRLAAQFSRGYPVGKVERENLLKMPPLRTAALELEAPIVARCETVNDRR